MQILLSVGLSAFAVWEMWDIGRRRLLSRWSGLEPSPSPAMPRSLAVRCAVAAAAVASLVAGMSQVHRGPTVGLLTAVVVGWSALCVIAVFVPVSAQ